jgi:hypothetical protein
VAARGLRTASTAASSSYECDDERATETELIAPSALIRISRFTVPLIPRRRADAGYWSDFLDAPPDSAR